MSQCCDCCEMESCQSWMKIESSRWKRTNTICDHINKWSKRKRDNMTDEMQWVVLTRSRPMRPMVEIIDWSVYLSVLSTPDARQHSFWGMWCILVCHPHLTIILCCIAVWAQACGLGYETSFCHYRSSLVQLAPSLVCCCRWWEQYHDTAVSGIDILTFATVTTSVQCVLVNTLQYHDTANLVHDSGTEDPQGLRLHVRVVLRHMCVSAALGIIFLSVPRACSWV